MKAQNRLLELAHYNLWCDRRLYKACAEIPKETLHEDLKLYFRSIFGILNHNAIVAELWYSRIKGKPFARAHIHEEVGIGLVELAEVCERMDKVLCDYIKNTTKEKLAKVVEYQSTEGKKHAMDRESILFHLFNHQTHHRGQITAALESLGYDFEPLDYIAYLYEESRQG
ncbi:DinB family protein [Wolinella succinogenes]|jgi:uncharacterized damage-inducible protein DinB|uniref:Damage-inducible protein DinB n=1 Tax=Wolinella succinogenes (strain ATCC 29543 / DSM 1740 / CCUG 13145 / JCM 31913 / LMG 7466 / NCTC 11488 / FDC 602W) TaxID=273121 RepID=Q7MRP7_WOLSU|nr:DinB family protein [Wolinella succinogenes]CAE10237.1 conserved hypothetical protein [Wolinella succinogenes]VEG80175.1 DinB family [Wolinella succinogenes]HCZ17917.1 hypothetical protein [Helicobacter sp.]